MNGWRNSEVNRKRCWNHWHKRHLERTATHFMNSSKMIGMLQSIRLERGNPSKLCWMKWLRKGWPASKIITPLWSLNDGLIFSWIIVPRRLFIKLRDRRVNTWELEQCPSYCSKCFTYISSSFDLGWSFWSSIRIFV